MLRRIVVSIIGAFSVITPMLSIAQTPSQSFVDTLYSGAKEKNYVVSSPRLQTPTSAISQLIKFALSIASIISVSVIIFGGISYMTTGGDEGKAKNAVKIITYAAVGLVLCFSSFIIINLLQTPIRELAPASSSTNGG